MTERDDKLDAFKAAIGDALDARRPRMRLDVKPIYDREPGEITGPGKLDGVTLTLDIPPKVACRARTRSPNS